MDGPINEPVTEDGPSDQSRREFLKRSAAAGVVAWSAPAILSLPGGGAWATHYPCHCPDCQATGTPVSIAGNAIGSQSNGCGCIIPLGETVAGITVSADVACAKADDESCTASTYLENVEISGSDTLLGEVLVTATTLSSCVDCGTGDSLVAELGVFIGGVEQDLDLSANCNGTAVDVLGAVKVVFNEQECTNGVLTVNALHVTILGVDVIIGQSQAGAEGCHCEACAADPRCTPPTEPFTC